MAQRDPPNQASKKTLGKDDKALPARKPPEVEDEELISPHPGIGGILADPPGRTDRRGG